MSKFKKSFLWTAAVICNPFYKIKNYLERDAYVIANLISIKTPGYENGWAEAVSSFDIVVVKRNQAHYLTGIDRYESQDICDRMVKAYNNKKGLELHCGCQLIVIPRWAIPKLLDSIDRSIKRRSRWWEEDVEKNEEKEL